MGRCLEDENAFLFPKGRRVKTISLFQAARKSYYAALLKSGVLCMVARKKPKKGLPDQFPSNADGDSATSIAIAQAIFNQIQSKAKLGESLAGQISRSKFEPDHEVLC